MRVSDKSGTKISTIYTSSGLLVALNFTILQYKQLITHFCLLGRLGRHNGHHNSLTIRRKSEKICAVHGVVCGIK